MSESYVAKYVAAVMKNSDLRNYAINQIESNKGEGCAGDIIFVTVEGWTEGGESKRLHLAVKTSKDSEELRKQLPMRELFLKEVYIYDNVKTSFETFQREKGLDCEIKFMPYCYTTVVENNKETLIFENLKAQGFGLWDKTVPMTTKHVRLILEAYGQWHALSMALKTQQPEIFGKLVENNTNMFSYILHKCKYDEACIKEFFNVQDSLIDDNELDVFKRFNFSADDMYYAFDDMYFEESEHHVILHGDCWNNNFLFKTPDDPSDVRILDWQTSGLATPAFDLSHFVFSCADTEKYQDVRELLRIYYTSFSRHLTSYGCDSEKVYSFDKLVKHWNKFSRFGLFLSCMNIKLCICSEKVPDLKETVERGGNVTDNFNISVDENTDNSVYLRRVKNNFLFYSRNVDIY